MKRRTFGPPDQKRFGRLLFISLAGFSGDKGSRRSMWLMQCDCGDRVVLSSNSVKTGNTASCGCLGDETRRTSTIKHGKTGTPTYISWAAMVTRCRNAKNPGYKKYGANGIDVCPQWASSFEQFLRDVGERPVGMTLDRIDNAKGYFPGNVRWATPHEQSKNRGNVKNIDAFGETLCLSEWEIKTGVSRSTIRKRIASGMPPEQALTLRRSRR